jgi:hypothetical protein
MLAGLATNEGTVQTMVALIDEMTVGGTLVASFLARPPSKPRLNGRLAE